MQEHADAIPAGAVWLRLLVVFLLVAANGFFVAAVRVHRGRTE